MLLFCLLLDVWLSVTKALEMFMFFSVVVTVFRFAFLLFFAFSSLVSAAVGVDIIFISAACIFLFQFSPFFVVDVAVECVVFLQKNNFHAVFAFNYHNGGHRDKYSCTQLVLIYIFVVCSFRWLFICQFMLFCLQLLFAPSTHFSRAFFTRFRLYKKLT